MYELMMCEFCLRNFAGPDSKKVWIPALLGAISKRDDRHGAAANVHLCAVDGVEPLPPQVRIRLPAPLPSCPFPEGRKRLKELEAEEQRVAAAQRQEAERQRAAQAEHRRMIQEQRDLLQRLREEHERLRAETEKDLEERDLSAGQGK